MILKIKGQVLKRKKTIKDYYEKVKREIISFFKEKGKIKKIKKLGLYLYQFLTSEKVLRVLLLSLPFIIMDISTRLFASSISFFPLFSFIPRMFSLIYICFILGFCLNIKDMQGKIIYSLIFIFFFILFFTHNVYYSTMNNFFSFSLMALAGEGSDYLLDTLKNCNIMVYIVSLITIISYVFAIKFFPLNRKLNKKRIIRFSIVLVILYSLTRMCLGTANFELTWDNWRRPRNVYNNFNDSEKAMALTGLYEYTVRDFYVNFIRAKTKKSEAENKFLEDVFASSNDSFHKNKYTARFKNKNIIFVQLEGIDNWLLKEDIMPNTYGLLKNSLNFTNHYSFYNGGGSTFNSEFSVNTGYVAPFTFPTNAYTLNKTDFPYSMANLLKQKDYNIKSFHMNNGEYYSRAINYYNWGYDNYYGLKDLGTYEDSSYQLDRELINNPTFYDEMFKNDSKFMNYIITYSNHMPFDSSKGVCNKLLRLDYANELENLEYEEQNAFIDNLHLTEEDCIKRQARETDDMMGLLIKGLKDNNLYNNTILVVFTDHYLYTISDYEILKKNGKDTETNLINKTPFFIFSAGMKGEEIKTVNSQYDILPTILNLMGISYNDKWYLGTDILDNKKKPMVIFSDLSWYDGTYYVIDGRISNNKRINDALLEEKNSYVEYLIKKNDLVLKYNYFKDMEN